MPDATCNGQTYAFQISYTGGTGNDVVLTNVASAIPEPMSFSLLGAGAMGLLARRRRLVKT